MTVAGLLDDLARSGIELWFEGDRLRFRAPKGALTADLRTRLSASRAEVLTRLRETASAAEKSHPLSFTQQSLWFLHQQASTSAAYHVALSAKIRSAVDLRAMRNALQALVDRHASLRTTYPFEGDAPRQRAAGAAVVDFVEHNVPDMSDVELRNALVDDYRRPFDLEHGPVFRASLYTRGPEDHAILITVHHIAVDGWSLMMLLDELTKLYAEATGGGDAALARVTGDYVDYSRWQEEMLAGPQGERLWSYWRDKLAAPLPQLELPIDHARPTVPSFGGASIPLEMDSSIAEWVKAFARQEGTTPFVVLLSTFHAFLFRLTGATDVIVGTPTFTRSNAEFMRVVGDFVNSVPLRVALDQSMSFRDLVARVRQTVLEALDAQEYPLPLLVRRLQPERESGRSPLFDTFFVFQRFDQFKDLQALLAGGDSDTIVEMGGLRFSPFSIDQQEGQFDLALQMLENEGELHGVLKYRTDLFTEATIRQFLTDYLSLLRAVVQNESVALGALPKPARAGGVANGRGAIATFLDELRSRDIQFYLEGERLRVNAPKGAMTDELKALVAERKEQIVALLRESTSNGSASSQNSLRRISRDGPLPVSSAQQRLWFLDRINPGQAHYNVGGCLRLRGPLDAALLREAADQLARRHESLRSRIIERDGAPEVEIAASPTSAFGMSDVSHVPRDEREAAALALSGDHFVEPFNIAVGPLVTYHLVRLSDDEYLFTMSMHHIVSDGWSMVIAMREIMATYSALAAGRAIELPQPAVDYVDFAAWEQEQLRTNRVRKQLNFWKQELAGAPALLELPTDRPRPAAQSFDGRRIWLDFDRALVEPLKQLGRQHDATLFMTLVAAFQVVLHRYSGQDDIVIGAPMANRTMPALEGIIGCFVNNLVLRGRIGGNPTFGEFLGRTKQSALSAFENADLPFDLVVDGVRPDRGVNHAPIFQVLFTLHSFATELTPPPGLTVEPVEVARGESSRFDLTAEITQTDDRFAVLYEFARALFDETTIVRLHGHLRRVLAAVVADPTLRVQDIPMLDAAEEQRLVAEWNATAHDHDRALCLHQLFERSARATPDAVAIVAGSSTLSYRELDERANRLAHLLQQKGVAPGSLVGVCVDRTVDMPVALAAVLKAGAAYVPLDPSHPADRLRYTLEDAGVACVVTQSRFAGLLADANAPLVVLDEVDAELAALPSTAAAVTVRPEDRAYVIYTSGSTGRPKGVEVEHRNVVAFLDAMRVEPGIASHDVLLAVTTVSFDIAGLEFWLPLSVGAKVIVASRADVLEGERLIGLIASNGVTMLQATPATWRLMLDAGWRGSSGLKALCGGEALPRDLAASLVPCVGELWNMYGPTETTIWSTVSRVDDVDAPITIGRPIANTRIYILEHSGSPAPIGVPGELLIGGEGVARGYHNRPELTAEKFVDVTLPGGARERVYRTGDMARYRADGRIEFLGRRDQQVKVRGYRIELGEIESVLATHAGVRECVVAVREDTPGDVQIVGYVVETDAGAFDADTARATLRGRLPEYMIPNVLVVLPALPLTPNGKIDRKALPAARPVAKPVARVLDALMTPAQKRVAATWRDVLRIDHVGLHDNFFDIGGHSLLLVKLHAGLKREFSANLELIDLFQWTTVEAQATRLSSVSAPNGALRRALDRAARQIDG